MELKEQFEKAAADSKNLGAKPDNETLLQLYSLYKQAKGHPTHLILWGKLNTKHGHH